VEERGQNSLIETIREIPLKNIRPSRLNPRLEINTDRLNHLASSIREVGLLEPIIVRPIGGEFEVVVGERRYRASQQAGVDKMTAIVREYADVDVVQLNLIENVQREELSAVEKGKVCKLLLDEYSEKYPSPSVLAERIGVTDDTVRAWLRSVDSIPTEAQKLVAPADISGEVPRGKIDYQTAARAGRQIQQPELQVEVIRKLADKHLPTKERTLVIQKVAQEPDRSVEDIIEEVAGTSLELAFIATEKQPIIDGTKTQKTSIDPPSPKLKGGASVRAIVWEPHFADLRIVSVERKKLRYFDDQDALREGCNSLKQFKTSWAQKHGSWDDDQLVYVVHFEKIQ
jgi:ParB/RepB/Spo0J family partition protein